MSYIIDGRIINKLKLYTADGDYVFSKKLEELKFNKSEYELFIGGNVYYGKLILELEAVEFRRSSWFSDGNRVIVPFIHMTILNATGGVVHSRETIAVVNHIPSSSNLTRLLLGSNPKLYKTISNDVTAGLGELYRNDDTLLMYTLKEEISDVLKPNYIVEEYLK